MFVQRDPSGTTLIGTPMTSLKICMLGGTGFVGRHLAARLCAAGHEVTILTRYRTPHRDLTVLPGTVVHEGDVYDAALLRREFAGRDAVINLVGILNERGRSGAGFRRAHVDLAVTVAAACRAANVPRLLHMSALNAAADAPSHYLRTKNAGELAVLSASSNDLRVTSFRPSVMFGREDDFLNRFATLLRRLPGVFPLACPEARFQPVYVGDVTTAFIRALTEHRLASFGYDLCGPKVYTLRELVEYIAHLMRRPTWVIGLNDRLARLQATIMEFVPGKPFSLDNYHSLHVDSVCPAGASVLRDVFGIEPTPLEQVAPGYITARRSA